MEVGVNGLDPGGAQESSDSDCTSTTRQAQFRNVPQYRQVVYRLAGESRGPGRWTY